MPKRYVSSFSDSNFKRVPVLYSLSIAGIWLNKTVPLYYKIIKMVNFYLKRISRKVNLTRPSTFSDTPITRISLFSMLLLTTRCTA